jgi:hypothetical protein
LDVRVCNGCRVPKPLTADNFYRTPTSRNRSGFRGMCKLCVEARRPTQPKRPVLTPEQKRERIREQNRTSHKNLKIKVLTICGADGKLQCCWPHCEVTDVDMLTLDHVHNDGHKDRRACGTTCSSDRYSKVMTSGNTANYQTLCWNHQWKKRINDLHREDTNSSVVVASSDTPFSESLLIKE